MTDAPVDRPDGPVAVMAEQCSARSGRGLVVAAAPVAATVGAQALADGGNAYDSAVAAALAETVLLPPKCGLAGDLVALAWHRGEPSPTALLAIGGAPAGLAAVAAEGRLDDTGPTSVGVPGAPAGYLALAARGRLGLERLASPAIDLARDGFAWSRICTTLTREAASLLRRHQPGGTRYLPGDRPIEPGALTVLPGLAVALERLVRDGDGFLSGPVGSAIVERVRSVGGVVTLDDLASARAEWVPTNACSVGVARVHVTPAPTHGPSLLDAVGDQPASTEAEVHRRVMASIATRRAELADPGGTSMVSAADDEGTFVTVVHSNSYPRFGSGVVVDELDLIISNRAGRGFSLEPNHPNFPVAGRRPATTLHAWAIADGRRRVQGATPGGANQMPWNAQTLTRLLRGAGPADAIVAPRWEWLPATDGLRIEDGFADEARVGLAGAGIEIEDVPRWTLRSAMQILDDPGADGLVVGAVDPRTQGAVSPR